MRWTADGATTRAVTAGIAVGAVLLAGAPATAGPLAPVQGAVNDLLDEPARQLGLCSELDTFECLLPLPNDEFTTADATTPTGLRIDLSELAMLRNAAGKPIDPTEWNRNDGWSPGSMLLTHVPGLDLDRTFGIDFPQVEKPSLSMAPDAPIVLLDADTGERHPYFAELDHHPETDPSQALLIIRPLRNFEHGHRYVVGLRGLRDGDGAPITARSAAFAAQVDAYAPGGDDVLDPLAAAGVDPAELFLAWDFTIASIENLAGRALAIRDDAFAALGDPDLADRVVQGDAPAFEVVSVQEVDDPESTVARFVEGRVTVPYYLDRPDQLRGDLPLLGGTNLGAPEAGPVPDQSVPGIRLNYASPSPGPMDTPVRNTTTPTIEAEFTCSIPRTATAADPAEPTIYGHGLLGSRGESRGGSGDRMREANRMICGVDWFGFYNRDIANVAVALLDMSNFPSLMDRVQQGYLHFLYVARALVHPEGVVTDPAFQDGSGAPITSREGLAYDGNSQGGIMGGALTALAPDWERAVLGVPGMNYSTLLHRSVDFEGDLLAPGVGYSTFMYESYPEKEDQLILMHLIQMLWDRGETNGFAHHATDDPLPNTPPHRILLHPALGDYQVTTLAAEVEARTIGAAFLQTAVPQGRHWADHTGERTWGLEVFDEDPAGPGLLPHDGSAIVYWDSGNPVPPSVNVPPDHEDQDPHEDPRRDPFAGVQKATFYETGEVVDPHAGRRWYCTHTFPRHPEQAYDCNRVVAAPAPPPAPAPAPLPATGGGAALAGLLALVGARRLRGR